MLTLYKSKKLQCFEIGLCKSCGILKHYGILKNLNHRSFNPPLQIVALNKTKERMRPYHGNQEEEDPDIKKIKKVNYHISCLNGIEIIVLFAHIFPEL